MNTTPLSPEERQQFWSEHIQNWRQSSLSRTAYCREHNLIVHRLTYWVRKSDATTVQHKSRAFIRVEPSPLGPNRVVDSQSDTRFTLHLSDRRTLNSSRRLAHEYGAIG